MTRNGAPPLNVGGAAIAGGVLGVVLAGPIIGVVAAGGAAAVAATNKGSAGTVARTAGGAIGGVHRGARDFDKKHRVVEGARQGIVEISKSAKEFDRKHGVAEKTKVAAGAAAHGFGSAARSAKRIFGGKNGIGQRKT